METAQAPSTENRNLVPQIKSTAEGMSGWLKFLGVVMIIFGVPSLIVLVGALYIWMGVLLYQAGTAAQSRNTAKLTEMMNKLKTYFIISGVLTALGLVVMLITFLTTGVSILSALM